MKSISLFSAQVPQKQNPKYEFRSLEAQSLCETPKTMIIKNCYFMVTKNADIDSYLTINQ